MVPQHGFRLAEDRGAAVSCDIRTRTLPPDLSTALLRRPNTALHFHGGAPQECPLSLAFESCESSVCANSRKGFVGSSMAGHAPTAPDRHVVWVRGPHLQSANGVLLAERRMLTSRQALFTYHDAENTQAEAVGADGASAVSAACCPAQCLLMNQAVEFSIVSVPAAFSRRAGVRPVRIVEDCTGQVRAGDTVAIVANTGGRAASGCTVVARLTVDDVTETELWLHALDPWARAEIGSPIFRDGMLVAIVVALPREKSEGLRALRIEAIVDRLKKRMQLEDALDDAPDVRYNSDGHTAVRVPAALSAGVLDGDACKVTEWTPVDHIRRALAQRLTQGAIASGAVQGDGGGGAVEPQTSDASRHTGPSTIGVSVLLGLALAGVMILRSVRK